MVAWSRFALSEYLVKSNYHLLCIKKALGIYRILVTTTMTTVFVIGDYSGSKNLTTINNGIINRPNRHL